MVTIKSKELTVTIAKRGAEPRSVSDSKTEYLWNARPEVWANTAPLMFPICGGLKENRYTHGGKEYTLNKHGFAKFSEFELESADGGSAVFLLRANAETKAVYPFDFELRAAYRLEGRRLSIDYFVKNLSEETMYFNIGSHEGYYTPEGIEEYDIVFDAPTTLSHTVLNGNLLTERTTPVLFESTVLPLYEKFFFSDALVFRDAPVRAASLRNRRTGKTVRVEFPDCRHLLVWHTPNAPFLCVEPWNGIPDLDGSSYQLSEKVGVTALSAGKEMRISHSITFQ